VVSESSERAAALVIRAWIEPEPGRPASAGLRARITYSTDLSATDKTELVAASPDEITAAVTDWLERFLSDRGGAARTSRSLHDN
jgi:hypothetical protein